MRLEPRPPVEVTRAWPNRASVASRKYSPRWTRPTAISGSQEQEATASRSRCHLKNSHCKTRLADRSCRPRTARSGRRHPVSRPSGRPRIVVLGVNRKYGSWDRITVRDGQAVSSRPPPGSSRRSPGPGARAEAPGHIAPRKLDRGKSAFLAEKATEVSAGWERNWERILLAPALGGSRPLAWAMY
jgi:hypothetical protein